MPKHESEYFREVMERWQESCARAESAIRENESVRFLCHRVQSTNLVLLAFQTAAVANDLARAALLSIPQLPASSPPEGSGEKSDR